MGSINEMDIMIENISETRPPSTNHLSLLMFTITGTIAVFTNLTKANLTATERLWAVCVLCFSLAVRYRTTHRSKLFIMMITKAQRKDTILT